MSDADISCLDFASQSVVSSIFVASTTGKILFFLNKMLDYFLCFSSLFLTSSPSKRLIKVSFIVISISSLCLKLLLLPSFQQFHYSLQAPNAIGLQV